MKIRKVDMYFANDGNHFFTQKACKEYEAQLAELEKIDRWNKESIRWFDNDGTLIEGEVGECIGRAKYFVVLNVEKAKEVFKFCYHDDALCHTIAWDGFLDILNNMEFNEYRVYVMENYDVRDFAEVIGQTEAKRYNMLDAAMCNCSVDDEEE